MTGLDTNILIRYLVNDDVLQSRKAADHIEHRLTESDPGFISAIVMVETVWVLESHYGFTDSEIAAAIQRILQIDAFVVEHRLEIFVAMVALKQRRGSFADALIGAVGKRAGCSRTFTFDRKASRLPSFELL